MAESAAMSRGTLDAGIACGLLALVFAGPAASQEAIQNAPQIALRLTGAIIATRLDKAQQDLASRAEGLSPSSLGATSQGLGRLADRLRKSLGNDLAKPVDTLGNDAKAQAYRAEAVAQRAQAFLEASKGCFDGDTAAMADALARTVELEGSSSSTSKLQPVINGVETLDHRPLFVLHADGKPVAFALTGQNLFDTQCATPLVSATDGQGKALDAQPLVTGVLPNRIELKLPDSSQLEPGSYVLHVIPQRKAFLLGCTAQPETTAALQVAPAAKVSVSYSLVATCPAAHGGQAQAMPPITGTMPDGAGQGTVSRYVTVSGCANPLSYAITATVDGGKGHGGTVGPVSQIASAGITVGLPGGLSLSWDPSVHQLVVRPAASSCKGVY